VHIRILPQRPRRFLAALAISLTPAALGAQSLPILHPSNPVAESRTGLYFQPVVAASPGWRFATALDYASMVEIGFRGTLADTSYLLDAEVLRLNLSATRDLGPRYFVTGEAWVGGAYNGFLDGFLNWYHGLFGIRFPEREDRPRNTYAYFYRDVAGRQYRFGRNNFGLGDVRFGLGRHHASGTQSVLSITLPTSTLGEGFRRGTPSVGLLNTYRATVTPRLVYEGSASTGFTPRHGELARFQNRFFFLGTSGIRWRTTGGLWSFGNLFLHSPYYSGTGAGQLDRWDFTVDFGWMIRGKSGREFRFGMTEDLWPSGPAVDANFRLGMTW
jgi:Protein of unknown function (DUF3187)